MAATDLRLNEEQIAHRARARVLSEVTIRRTRYLVAAVLPSVVGVVWFLTTSNANGILLVLVGAIFAVLYLDTNGLVHEVRQQPARKLTTDLSVLEEHQSSASTDVASRSTRPAELP